MVLGESSVNKNKMKDWTILIYADGNNELAPEMWRAKIEAEKTGSCDKVNVVMELGRESSKLVKIIRPHYTMEKESEVWTGVRRYYVLNSKSKLIEDLGKINMASPSNLYNFITWGVKNYPAEKYMVVLSGHGGSFVAVLSDLSQNEPYMMGIVEMSRVLNMAAKDAGVSIDVLVLDSCSMNTIEIIYELGKDKGSLIRYLLTYIGGGPINGLPYNKLIEATEQNSNSNNLICTIKNVIDAMNLSLAAIEINYRKFRQIKEVVSKLAYSYLTNEPHIEKKPEELIYNLEKDFPWCKYSLELQNKLNEIVIYHKNTGFEESSIVGIITKDMYSNDIVKQLMPFYCKLSFGKNNYWSYVLSNKEIHEDLSFITDTNLHPLIVMPRGVRNIVWAMNPDFNEEEVDEILKKLYDYKKWEEGI